MAAVPSAIAATTALPHISRSLLVRGGAVAAAAVSSALTSSLQDDDSNNNLFRDALSALPEDSSNTAAALSVSGGETSLDDGTVSLFGLTITPEARATFAMVRTGCTSYACFKIE